MGVTPFLGCGVPNCLPLLATAVSERAQLQPHPRTAVALLHLLLNLPNPLSKHAIARSNFNPSTLRETSGPHPEIVNEHRLVHR